MRMTLVNMCTGDEVLIYSLHIKAIESGAYWGYLSLTHGDEGFIFHLHIGAEGLSFIYACGQRVYLSFTHVGRGFIFHLHMWAEGLSFIYTWGEW